MSRLIDADALIHELNNSSYPGAPYVDAGISIAIGKVCDAQTIEPERQKKKTVFVECDRVLTQSEYLDMCEAMKRQAADDVKIVLLGAGFHVAWPEPHWIPCSERLPEAGQNCLVCDNGAIYIDTFIGKGNPYNWKWYIRDYEAWMPLPEPWEGDQK